MKDYAPGRIVGLLGVAASMTLLACQSRNDDINTVQPGFVKKALFQTTDEWFYRRTVAQSEVTNAYATDGSGDLWIERVKFRVEENLLLAYRPYEAIPGTESNTWEGGEEFEGSVIGAWPITSHFDIQRGYDPLTGNGTNVIGENVVDRPWHEREFMRVDWASNLVENSFAAGWGIYEFPITYISSGSYWSHIEATPTDPFASRFSEDYIEVTDSAFLAMDLINCAWMTGFTDEAYGSLPGPGCGFGEAKIRHSFQRITQNSDYIPRNYPDSVVRKDADGKAISDPDTGEVLREPLYDRFGIFRIETPSYDPGYGLTETGRNFRALLFNIWERHTDDNGKLLSYAQRTPKPIIYYLNVDYPARWRQSAARVADDYNRVFTQMSADLLYPDQQGAGALAAFKARFGDEFRMFEIRDNTCNEPNVRSFVASNPDYRFAVQRAVCRSGETCGDPMDQIGVGNLAEVCTSLEAATRDPATGKPAFDWQRVGDNRFKMVVYLNQPQESGWGGYGPMHADARTGETISASSYIRGNAYEAGAATVVDYIELINDEKKADDIYWGQDIRRQVAQTVQDFKAMTNERADGAYVQRMETRFAELGQDRKALLQEIDPNWQLNRLKATEGTRVESDHMITDEALMLASNGTWKPGMPIPEGLRERASPRGRISKLDPLGAATSAARRAMTNAGFCYFGHDFDPHWAGLALALKDQKDRTKRYEFVYDMMLRHVMAHELGHNFGLSHNFEGSYDALNYYDGFWQLYGDGTNGATEEEKVQGRLDEKRNSTVMEYMSTKGLFANELGPYDEAALRFAYAEQVSVFDDESVAGGQEMRNWRYRNDYSRIPEYVCNGNCASAEEIANKLKARHWETFDPQSPPTNEVPFLFCDNYYDRRTPFCATFDVGSNLREIHANHYSRWKDYFFFNNFSRDRLQPITWYWPNAEVPAIYAMRNVSLVNEYLYYLRSTDPNFLQTDLGIDMLTTVGQGLNMAAEIVSMPEPLRMCPTGDPSIYIPWYFLRSGCDERLDVTSPAAVSSRAIQLPLGPARPVSFRFSDDFVNYSIDTVGSYFDKVNVLWLLGVRSSSLFRYEYQLDLRNYQISLFRLFEPEVRTFYDQIMNIDGYYIDLESAQALGAYWCNDPEAPGTAYRGHYEPRRLIDPVRGVTAPGPTQSCVSPVQIYPNLVGRVLPFQAMFWSFALFSSPLDTELDMSKSLKIFVLGSDDEFPDWRNVPAEEVCSCVDDLTGLDYRSIRQPEGLPSLGCQLIERACDAQANYKNAENDDNARYNWRAWFERLEYARDLSRIYDR